MRRREGISVGTELDGRALPVSPRYSIVRRSRSYELDDCPVGVLHSAHSGFTGATGLRLELPRMAIRFPHGRKCRRHARGRAPESCLLRDVGHRIRHPWEGRHQPLAAVLRFTGRSEVELIDLVHAGSLEQVPGRQR